MFLVSLTRPLTRRIAPRLAPGIPTRTFASGPPIDQDIQRLIEAEGVSESDPNVRSEPPHASILTPPKVASTSRELFGDQERTTLQTLPNGFDTRKLPLPGPLPDEFTEIEYAATVVHGRSIHRPFIHPRTHGLPAAQIQFRSHDILTMHLFVHFATHAATALGIPCSRMYSLPTQRSLWTVLRGPFAHKKAQENFERKVHRRGIKAYDADPAVVELWFKYLRRHAMGGVGMRCVKWERMPIGVGRKTNINVVDNLNRNKQLATTRSKIKGLGDKIVQREMGFVEATTKPDNLKTVEN